MKKSQQPKKNKQPTSENQKELYQAWLGICQVLDSTGKGKQDKENNKDYEKEKHTAQIEKQKKEALESLNSVLREGQDEEVTPRKLQEIKREYEMLDHQQQIEQEQKEEQYKQDEQMFLDCENKILELGQRTDSMTDKHAELIKQLKEEKQQHQNEILELLEEEKKVRKQNELKIFHNNNKENIDENGQEDPQDELTEEDKINLAECQEYIDQITRKTDGVNDENEQLLEELKHEELEYKKAMNNLLKLQEYQEELANKEQELLKFQEKNENGLKEIQNKKLSNHSQIKKHQQQQEEQYELVDINEQQEQQQKGANGEQQFEDATKYLEMLQNYEKQLETQQQELIKEQALADQYREENQIPENQENKIAKIQNDNEIETEYDQKVVDAEMQIDQLEKVIEDMASQKDQLENQLKFLESKEQQIMQAKQRMQLPSVSEQQELKEENDEDQEENNEIEDNEEIIKQMQEKLAFLKNMTGNVENIQTEDQFQGQSQQSDDVINSLEAMYSLLQQKQQELALAEQEQVDCQEQIKEIEQKEQDLQKQIQVVEK